MKCHMFQRRLLGADSPDSPADDIQAHLDACASCREWQGWLIQMEKNVALLPVPRSNARADFVQRFLLNSPTDDAHASRTRDANGTPVSYPLLSTHKDQGLQLLGFTQQSARVWRYAAIGMAASLLLFLLGWWSLEPPQTSPRSPAVVQPSLPPDPLVASLMTRNLVLAKAKTAEERAEALAYMASDLRGVAGTLSPTSDMNELRKDLKQLHDRITVSLSRMVKTPEAPGPGDRPASRLADKVRVQMLQRNKQVIQSLVDGGLKLAGEADPLKRADSCKDMVIILAGEIRQAAFGSDAARAVEMGQHLQNLLREGVADNLSTVRRNAPVGSVFEPELRRVGDWVAEVTQPLEEQLSLSTNLDDSHRQRAFQAVRVGRAEVEKALRG